MDISYVFNARKRELGGLETYGGFRKKSLTKLNLILQFRFSEKKMFFLKKKKFN